MSVTGQQGPQVRPLADVLDVAALGERHRLVVADQSHVAEPLSSSALEPHELYTVCFDTPAAPAIEAMVVGPVTVLAGESFGRIQDPELSGLRGLVPDGRWRRIFTGSEHGADTFRRRFRQADSTGPEAGWPRTTKERPWRRREPSER